jgi:pyrroloquinoline quinone (PQQ) biosynthesis protein C
MPVPTEALVGELRAIVDARHCKDHPVVVGISRGELSHEQLVGFTRQFYHIFPRVFPRPIALLYARCPADYPELERLLIENIVEEGTGFISGKGSHRDQYLQFSDHLGIPRAAMERIYLLPETRALINWRETLLYQRTFVEAAAAQGFGFEGQSAARMERLVAGFSGPYGFPKEVVHFWDTHAMVEDDHAKVGPLAVARYATTDETQDAVREAVRGTAELFWHFFDGIQRAFVERAVAYEPWRHETTQAMQRATAGRR